METMIGFIAGLPGRRRGRAGLARVRKSLEAIRTSPELAAWPGRRRASAESSSSRSAAAAWQAWSARSPAGWTGKEDSDIHGPAHVRARPWCPENGRGLTARRPTSPSGLASLGGLLIARIPPTVPGSQACGGTSLVFPADTCHGSDADRQRDHARLEGALARETCHCRQPDQDHDHVLVAVCRTRPRWPARASRGHAASIPRRSNVDRHFVPLPGRWARLVRPGGPHLPRSPAPGRGRPDLPLRQ